LRANSPNTQTGPAGRRKRGEGKALRRVVKLKKGRKPRVGSGPLHITRKREKNLSLRRENWLIKPKKGVRKEKKKTSHISSRGNKGGTQKERTKTKTFLRRFGLRRKKRKSEKKKEKVRFLKENGRER